MNVIYDKTSSQLAISDAPLEANKASIKVNEYSEDFPLTSGKLLLTNFNINIPLTLQAIKVEEVTTQVPQFEADGVTVVLDANGMQVTLPKIDLVETVLESKIVDLKVL